MKGKVLKSIFTIILLLSVAMAYSQKKEERNVSGFSGISLGVPAELYLAQGSPQSLVIQASENDLEDIITEVRGDLLRIRTNRWNGRFNDVKIWVTVPDISELHMSGSGKIIAKTAIHSDEIELRVSGSGKIFIDKLKAEEVDASISGSGTIALEGTAEEMDMSISGSGSYSSKGLSVAEVDARISGSGNCTITVTGELDASISGSGRITYYGNPLVNASVSGSGKVKSGN